MSQTTLSLLLFDKSEFHLELLENALEKQSVNADIAIAKSISELLETLENSTINYIILFQTGTGSPVTELVKHLPAQNKNIHVFVITEEYNRETAIKLMDSGADNVFQLDELDFFIRELNRLSPSLKQTSIIADQRKVIQKDQLRFQTLVNNIPTAVAYLHQGAFISINPAFAKLFKMDTANKIAETSLLDIIEDTDREKVKHLLNTLEKSSTPIGDSLDNITMLSAEKLNTKVSLQCHTSNLNGEDCIQIIAIPEVRIDEKPIIKNHAQTQLFSPEYFIQKLNQHIKSSDEKETALCIMEAADYYRIKKNLGITRAEKVMQQVHDLMMSFNNENVLITQIGTDVYSLLISKDSKNDCIAVVESIQKKFNDTKLIMEDYNISMPLNTGVVHISSNITSPDQAFSLADVACTVSRNRKQHKLHIYNPEQDRSTVEAQDQNWTTRIKDAIENDNFKLVFQPIISLKTPGAANYEVLLRMKSSTESDILPNQFLHAAKQSDLEIEIDQWVIANALKQLNSTKQTDTTIFIKLCETSLRSIDFMNWLEKLSLRDRRQMVLEISEEMALKWPSDTLNLLNERQHCGYKVCIEQFGNHPESQLELLELNADFYKIDGTFINHLATNRKHQSIIHKIALSTKGRNIKIIACFVQDADSLAILWQEGIDYIQGNYLQTPQSDFDYQFESAI